MSAPKMQIDCHRQAGFFPRINASSKHSIGSVDGLFLELLRRKSAAQDDNIVLHGCRSDGVLSRQKRRRAAALQSQLRAGSCGEGQGQERFLLQFVGLGGAGGGAGAGGALYGANAQIRRLSDAFEAR